MHVHITEAFIDEIAAKYGADFKGGYAYSQTISLMKTYVLLANNEGIIAVSLGASGEIKDEIYYPYAKLDSFVLKESVLTNKAIIKPNGGEKIEFTIPKKTSGTSDYQNCLINFLAKKVK